MPLQAADLPPLGQAVASRPDPGPAGPWEGGRAPARARCTLIPGPESVPRHVAGSFALSVKGPPDMSPRPGRMRGCSSQGWKLLVLELESGSLEGQPPESCLGRRSSSWALTLDASRHAVGTLVGAPSSSTARAACVSHTHRCASWPRTSRIPRHRRTRGRGRRAAARAPVRTGGRSEGDSEASFSLRNSH